MLMPKDAVKMSNASHKDKILYAFNDLTVSKVTFDFVTFIQLAAFHCKRYGYTKIHFVFTPGPKNGFRNDDLPPNDADSLRGMLRNLALPACWLRPECVGVSYLATREETKFFLAECEDNIFPRDYTVENPVPDYMWPGINATLIRGEEMTPLVAPKEAQIQAAAYCELVSNNRKLITITLRESSYYTERNSQIPEWKKFIDSIDKSKYAVVIVRDTEKTFSPALFEGIPECSLASYDIGFRTALYEKSYLSMFTNNGTLSIACHAFVPYLSFGMKNESHHASSIGFFKNILGLSYGDQFYGFPSSQKLVWEKDNFETIKTEFDKHVLHIESHPDGQFPMNTFQSETQILDTCNSVVGYIGNKMSRSSMDEDRDALLKIVELSKGNNAQAFNLLGVWYANKSLYEESEKALHNAIQADTTFKRAYLNLAAIYQNTAKSKEALRTYFHFIETVEASIDVLDLAVRCAVAQGNIASAQRLVQKAETINAPPESILSLRAYLPS